MWYTCRQWNEIVHFLCDTLCIQSLCECEFCTHRYSNINISYVADYQVTGQVDWDDRLTWNDLVSVVLLLYFVCLIECVFEPICISVFLRIHCFPVLNTLTVSSVQLQHAASVETWHETLLRTGSEWLDWKDLKLVRDMRRRFASSLTWYH